MAKTTSHPKFHPSLLHSTGNLKTTTYPRKAAAKKPAVKKQLCRVVTQAQLTSAIKDTKKKTAVKPINLMVVKDWRGMPLRNGLIVIYPIARAGGTKMMQAVILEVNLIKGVLVEPVSPTPGQPVRIKRFDRLTVVPLAPGTSITRTR